MNGRMMDIHLGRFQDHIGSLPDRSVTTAVACAMEGRSFWGCEVVPEYHAVCMERVRNLQTTVTLEGWVRE